MPLPPVRRQYFEHALNRSPEARQALKKLAIALTALRIERGLSQGELAERAGTSNKTLSNLERGHNWPSMPLYLRLCVVLRAGVPPLL